MDALNLRAPGTTGPEITGRSHVPPSKSSKCLKCLIVRVGQCVGQPCTSCLTRGTTCVMYLPGMTRAQKVQLKKDFAKELEGKTPASKLKRRSEGTDGEDAVKGEGSVKKKAKK